MGSVIETRAAEAVEVKTEMLVESPRNSRTHSAEQVAKIRKSLREFGFVAPIIIDRDMNVLAGHGRLAAARAEGMKSVPCVFADGMTNEQKRAYMIADNRIALDAGWDCEILRDELDALRDALDVSAIGFGDDEMADIFAKSRPRRGGDDYDAAAAAAEPPFVRRGEIWTLGAHRLICGDSTDADTVARLMDGRRARLVVTDPPYNVAYTGIFKSKRRNAIKNDDMGSASFENFIRATMSPAIAATAPGAAFYVFCSSATICEFMGALRSAGIPMRQVLVWVKDHFVLSRQDYNWQHELIIYGWKDGAPHRFYGAINQSTVADFRVDPDAMSHEELVKWAKRIIRGVPVDAIDARRPSASVEHPTMKPVELLDRLIRNSSMAGELVLDPFGGSGSTLVACERAGRKCAMVELEETYASVIVRRYVAETGDADGAFTERGGRRVTFACATETC